MMKMKDMMAAAKTKMKVSNAKAERSATAKTARTPLEREIIVERAKAKEAQAKMELHQEKAENRARTAARRGYFPFFGGNRRKTTGATAAGTGYAATPHNRKSYFPFFGNRRKTATGTTASRPAAVY